MKDLQEIQSMSKLKVSATGIDGGCGYLYLNDYAEYDNEDEKAHTIIRHYGAKHQLLKLAEECAELTQQCMKCFDLDLQYGEDFIEELADVKVMLMQFESILSPAFAEMYERIITEKLDRQLKRMEVQSG